jgi:hypothetical protein
MKVDKKDTLTVCFSVEQMDLNWVGWLDMNWVALWVVCSVVMWVVCLEMTQALK